MGGDVRKGDEPGVPEVARSSRRRFADIITAGAGATATTSPVCRHRKVDDVIAAIDEFDRDELERVAIRLGVLLESKSAKGREKKLLELDWHAMATQVLSPMGVPVPPMAVVAKLPFVASFRRGVVAAEDYVVAMQPRSRPDWIRGRLLVCANLLEWMRGYKVPVSFKSFAQNLQNAPTAMEKAYPGYRQSGLLGSVLASKGSD